MATNPQMVSFSSILVKLYQLYCSMCINLFKNLMAPGDIKTQAHYRGSSTPPTPHRTPTNKLSGTA